MLSAADLEAAAEAAEALAHMRAYGWDADTDVGHAYGYVVAPDATASEYANDHGRFDVRDRMILLTLYHPRALDPRVLPCRKAKSYTRHPVVASLAMHRT